MLDVGNLVELPQNPFFEDRYSTRGILGVGGVGEVALCLDRWIGREVAVKTLREGEWESTGGTAERFLREARVQAQLEHPSVVPVYECGVRPDGREYFSMQRVRGATLADVIVGRAELRGEPSRTAAGGLRRLLEAFARLCLAVDYAHSRGVIHRDLKPSNVMLGDFGEIYLLDWGVAKVTGSADNPSVTRTSTTRTSASCSGPGATEPGTWLGTVGYMAPEQIQGGSVDLRADVYALGAILFEILTHQRLHVGTVPSDIVHSTLEGVEARPSVRFPVLEVPPEFDAILVRATNRDPELRYQTARALCQDVERFLDGDRDHSLRRELAQRHAEVARESLGRLSIAGDEAEEKHVEALHNVGRALALDPNNNDALAVLGELLLHEPTQLPKDVQHLEQRSASLLRLRAMRTLFLRVLTWTAFIPLTAWMGYISLPVGIGVASTVVLTVIWLYALRRRQVVGVGVMLGAMLLLSLVCLGASAMFGPFVIVPALVATNISFFILHLPPRFRWWVVAVGILTVLLPFILGLLDWIPAAYRFIDGRIVIEPTALAYPALGSTVMLILAHVVMVLTPGLVAMRVQNALASAERRILLYTWRVSQLSRVGGFRPF
jgi:eukaryotic-like serine/threonine-protein kinase